MLEKKFDTFIIGQISRDINIDYDGTVTEELGGAVVHSAYAASNTGYRVGVLPKANTKDVNVSKAFEEAPGVTVFPVHSRTGTSIKNQYHTADREHRTCTALAMIEPYAVAEIPGVESELYHVAGLMRGDVSGEIIEYASKRGKAAVDVQGFLRCAENGSMVFRDWEEKKKYLPLITYLKTDAAEAEIMTGQKDRAEAARILFSWGAKEIMITHNTEVLVFDGKTIYSEPLKPKNLSGRTGRGDTCFSGYINERIRHDIGSSLKFAAALVSLKMGRPGPFKGTREDVVNFIYELKRGE